jgi:hypothetical protein
LIDYGQSNPAVPEGHPFTRALSQAYWTSSTVDGSEDRAWAVNLTNGNAVSTAKTVQARVWPVRDPLP